MWNYKSFGPEPPDHGIGRSRGGLTSKVHLVCDGKGRMLSAIVTAGNVNDTVMLVETLEQVRVPRLGGGRPRQRPERVIADKGYPSRANRAWLAGHGIKTTIPDRADQHANRGRRGSRGGSSARVRRGDLPWPERGRALFQPAQELAGHRDAQR